MATRARTRLRLAEDFGTLVARAGLSKREFARRSGISYATIKALENPAQHPHRTGGMRRDTAWKLAKAYAAATGVDEETAFARLVVEEPIDAVDT
jgi:transcriptional regulator with XRE-family HTH domain